MSKPTAEDVVAFVHLFLEDRGDSNMCGLEWRDFRGKYGLPDDPRSPLLTDLQRALEIRFPGLNWGKVGHDLALLRLQDERRRQTG